MKYLIVTYSVSSSAGARDSDIKAFEEKVAEKLKEGYTLVGGITMGKNTRWEDQMLYAQAMVKE